MAKKFLGENAVGQFVKWAIGKFAALSHKHTKSDITDFPVVLTGGKQTATSTADGGENVYTFTDSSGKTSTLIVRNGTKGSKGDAGTPGKDGAPGADGKNGTPGAAGKDGANGITPHIDPTTGNWFIGTTDTNVHAQGSQGNTGATGPQGPTGATGTAGKNGTNGARGSRWSIGTAITGTSTTATAYATGITDALVNDMYLNTSTGYVYRCTVAGNASTAKWVYAGSIRGPQGATGPTGPQGETGAAGKNGTNGTNGTNGKDGLTTEINIGGTAYKHSNGTITIPDSIIQTVAKKSCLPLSGGTVTGTAIFSKTTAASATADNRPALIVGGAPTAAHVEMDGNSVQAKANATSAAAMYINPDGGATGIGYNSDADAAALSVADAQVLSRSPFVAQRGASGIITVVSGSGTKTTALPAYRTKALIMVWAHSTNTLAAPVFNNVYVTGLSSNMTAKNSTSIIAGSAGTVTYSISTAGAITISVTGNCGWTLIYFN